VDFATANNFYSCSIIAYISHTKGWRLSGGTCSRARVRGSVVRGWMSGHPANYRLSLAEHIVGQIDVCDLWTDPEVNSTRLLHARMDLLSSTLTAFDHFRRVSRPTIRHWFNFDLIESTTHTHTQWANTLSIWTVFTGKWQEKYREHALKCTGDYAVSVKEERSVGKLTDCHCFAVAKRL